MNKNFSWSVPYMSSTLDFRNFDTPFHRYAIFTGWFYTFSKKVQGFDSLSIEVLPARSYKKAHPKTENFIQTVKR